VTTSHLSLWQVAPPGPSGEGPGTGVVSLTSPQPPVPAGAVGLWFHEAMEHCDLRAEKVDVWLPAYRGKSLVSLLSWLVTERLAGPGAPVTWRLTKQQGPDSIARMLAKLGWDNLTKERAGRYTVLTGEPPAMASLPEPAVFTDRIGAQDLTFSADYGVFSPRWIDNGTAWLAEVALCQPAVETIADIGIGYGALAIGLVLNGTASNAEATDIDSVALWLAQRNARRYDVDLKVVCTPNPLDIAPTPLTVCNMPTHINAASSGALMAGLVQRARHGRVLIVVHQSLEVRYSRHLSEAGLMVDRYPGPAHVVLAAKARRSS
jgi:16S rRNA G1207 methylase RsmC